MMMMLFAKICVTLWNTLCKVTAQITTNLVKGLKTSFQAPYVLSTLEKRAFETRE